MSIESALLNTAGALRAFTRVLDVTQNNVTNASTPGYARQRQTLEAVPFQPSSGGMGGVRAGEIQSARDQYAESAVRRETTALGAAQQQVDSLTSLESVFDLSDGSGVAGALSDLFASFSGWGQSGSDASARQAVIDNAAKVAQSFHQTAAALTGLRGDVETQLQANIDSVNRLTAQLAAANRDAQQAAGPDAGIDARMNATLEELSQYAGITAMPQAGGTVDVLLDGQIPLVIGGRQYQLDYGLQNGAYPQARVLSQGADVTAKLQDGSLGALLDLHNKVLPSYLGSDASAGDLNLLAKQFADRVNETLGPGHELFFYDPHNGAAAAQSLALDSNATAANLASVSGSVPAALSGLSSERQDALGGSTFSEFYGNMAARAGSGLSDARNEQHAREASAAQAKSLRDQMSGVSLDEEAMIVIEFQRAYEANSKLITVLDQLTQDTINILQT